MTKPLVTVDGVGLWYGGFKALDGVSAEFDHGSCTVICGPSGSGKSSLLRCLNRLEEFQEGEVTFDGVGLRNCRDLPRIRYQIGMVFQHFELYPHMRVVDNVTLAPKMAKGRDGKDAEKAAMRLLEMVGIGDQARKYPAELSGGQQQRAAIARALALEPKLMLFDEPTSALDPEMIVEVLKVIRDLALSGMTMIIVTHEMAFAREVADEIVFMDKGRIVERAPTETFFVEPQAPRAKEFLNRILRRI
jgi:ABC-type polar amino acid transport system ATPase subunit